MAKQKVELENGETVEFESKKKMLMAMAKQILEQYDEPITLRQLYYRFVGNDWLDNKQSQYQYLGEAVRDARLGGYIDYDAIEDRLRDPVGGDHPDIDPSTLLEYRLGEVRDVPDNYHRPRWEGQDVYLEVLVEKAALQRLFRRVCDPMGVTVFPCKGYPSLTSLKETEERFREHPDKEWRILYFGDFDPSGKDIQRSLTETLRWDLGMGRKLKVERRALTRDQIDRFELPPQPAKSSDSRYEYFVAEHGDMAVELDALEPPELTSIVEDAIDEYFDDVYYREEVRPEENKERGELREAVEKITDVTDDIDFDVEVD